jgi:uncharacterized damage-inducible protein DinB
MPEIRRISDQMQRTFDGDPWYGSPLMRILDDIDCEQAAAHPIVSAHSIHEIVLHVAAWKGAVIQRLRGKKAELPAEGDWPQTACTEETWQQSLKLLRERHNELIKLSASLDDDALWQMIGEQRDPATGSGVNVYYTLHGIIQHDVYHAGQIAILKKAVME